MAEAVVVGLLQAIITGLLEKSGSLLAEEACPELKSSLCLEKEVQKLEGTFGDIKAVLEDAEKRQVVDAIGKRWLGQLKESAYDIDNVLDELETAMIKSKIEEEEEKDKTTTAIAKVWSRSSPCISWIFKEITKFVQHVVIVLKIKNLNGTFDEIAIGKANYTFLFGSTSSPKLVKRQETCSLVDVNEIHGHDKHRDDLVTKLLGEGSEGNRGLYVISLVGMGGIGKTTLAKLAYNDAKVQTLFDIKVWVCVSNPFDECRVAQAIIEEDHIPKSTKLEGLINEILELIKEKKFLLVLDDVWTQKSNDWKPFKYVLQYGGPGSRILITTRNEGVAKMVGSVYTINLGILSDENCWSICSQIADVKKDDMQLGELGRKLAKKCKGLPLVANTLGSLMQRKRSRQEWEDILESNLWELENVQEDILVPLSFSYYEQTPAVKSCFLYCALFPKNHLFCKNELIYLWMAQGYLVHPNKEMEIVGEDYFEKLVMWCFFQDFEKDNNDKIIKCKMNDIVHDIAQLMIANECFTINGDKELGKICKSACHLRLELKGETQLPVSMHNLKNVRTLFFITQETIFPLNLFEHLTCLRVLTLKDNSFEKLPDEVEKLIHLRLLDLSNSNKITELPETVCNLCNLQTLNISGCKKIMKLPQGMGKLIKLRHLIIDGCSSLTKIFPKGIDRLRSLRTLNIIIIGGEDNREGCKLEELKNLNHLNGSLEIKGLENVTKVQEAQNVQLKNKRHLRELGLSFGSEVVERSDDIVLNALEPHSYLESLMIDYYMGEVYPDWMMSLSCLKRLKLLRCPFLKQLPPLGKMPLLETLIVENAYSVEKVGVEFLGIEETNGKEGSTSFPNLKRLIFNSFSKLEEWDGMGESGDSVLARIMPHLQILDIKLCPMLKALPNFLKTTSLEELRIDCHRISNWMTFATSLGLKKLNLNLSEKVDIEHLPSLGSLPYLESLHISNAHKVKKVGIEFLGIEEESNKKKDEEKGSSSSSSSSLVLFPNLVSLTFVSLKEWEEWDGIGEEQERGVTITIMPHLQILDIKLCPMLKALPNFLKTTSLEELRIDCHRISNWMTFATSPGLKKLNLDLSEKVDIEHLPSLGTLPYLESLHISNAHKVKKVGIEFLGIEEESNKKKDKEKGSSSSSSSLVLFPNLVSLTFVSLKEWEEWDRIGEEQERGVTITIMPCLQELSFYNCDKLKSLPDFLHKTSLKQILIQNCSILSQCP